MQPILDFLAQFVARLFSGKPAFFSILQVIAGILAAVNVTLSSLIGSGTIKAGGVTDVLTSGITLAIALTTAIVSQLPKKDPNTVAAK